MHNYTQNSIANSPRQMEAEASRPRLKRFKNSKSAATLLSIRRKASTTKLARNRTHNSPKWPSRHKATRWRVGTPMRPCANCTTKEKELKQSILPSFSPPLSLFPPPLWDWLTFYFNQSVAEVSLSFPPSLSLSFHSSPLPLPHPPTSLPFPS